MATTWSSEFIAAEHRDLHANAMAVDCTGIYVLLAGRRYLAIKNLNDQSDVLRKFPRQSKYEVGAAEWNPSSSHKDVCAISSNQRVEILSWRGGELEQLHLLSSHTRVVSDVNWHRFDPNLLASCSIDTFIHVWDMRDTRRPAQSLSAIAGSTQVRWNRLSCFLLATAHDGDIKLWDQRKGTAPVAYISAHLAKIHGLDWSPIHEDQLATSSQDCTVKFFDITKPRRAESVLPTTSPVWRARYTPFGEGLVTVVVPQLRRGENSLLLWNINNKTAPIHTFVGHTDVVLEFEWRKVNSASSFSDVSDFELITWSRDQCLRIWRIDSFLQKLCGHEPDMDHIINSQDLIDDLPQSKASLLQPNLSQNLRDLTLDNTAELSDMIGRGRADALSVSMDDMSEAEDGQNSSGALSSGVAAPLRAAPLSNGATKLDSESSDRPPPVRSPTQPKTLQQEFSLLNVNIPNVKVDSMDALRRVCNVTATANGHKALLHIQFPPNYPYSSPPTFQFITGTSLSPAAISKLLQVLKHTAHQRVQKNRSCLDACLRQLVISIQQLSLSEEPDSSYLRMPFATPYMESSNPYRNYTDKHIPFPRSSGARFSGVGLLVCFGKTPSARRLSGHPENCTPRSLFQLSSSWTNSSVPTHPSFFYQDRGQIPRGRQRSLHTNSRALNPVGRDSFSRSARAKVVIYDVSPLFLLHRELGEKYLLYSNDVVGMCQHNAMVAAQVGRQDLVQAWMTASLAASSPPQDPDDDVPWSQHPFGRTLINALVSHYAKESDIQMAAMLCCAFGVRPENQDCGRLRALPGKSSNISPGGSPYHTIHPIDTTLEGWNYPLLKQNRSNSWSDSLEGLRFNSSGNDYPSFQGTPVAPLTSWVDRNARMLDDDLAPLYDEYKRAYADILHRWDLLDARAQVLKYLSTSPEPHKGVEFVTDCSLCSRPVRGPACTSCNQLSLKCVICHISVRGSSNFCIVCGHGGHTTHMWLWFRNETQCPTGCGCSCLMETSSAMDS